MVHPLIFSSRRRSAALRGFPAAPATLALCAYGEGFVAFLTGFFDRLSLGSDFLGSGA
jgi:hypothetical protein